MPKTEEELRYQIVDLLKTVVDPELGLNIYDLGLVYGIHLNAELEVVVILTFTTPHCPFAQAILDEVRQKITGLDWVKAVSIEVTFDPPWTTSMMSEEALLEAGLL